MLDPFGQRFAISLQRLRAGIRTLDVRKGTTSLILVLTLGLYLRLHGLDFGLPALNDPDELMFQMGAVRMLSGPTLNPGWFGHPGTTTIYLLAVIDACVFAFGWALGWFSSAEEFAQLVYSDPTWAILPGRAAMVAFAVLSIFLTYRLASSLYDRRVGLAAGAILAVNPVHVYWSQVIRTDIMAVCFMLLCMLSALQFARNGRLRDAIWATAWLALAVATKWPFAISGLAIFGAVILRIRARPSDWVKEVRRAILLGGLSVVFLVLVSPFLVLDYTTVLRNLHGEAQTHHLGATGGGFLSNAAWYLCGPLLSGIGFLGAVAALVGSFAMVRNREAGLIVAPIAACFFLVICAQNLVWERWTLPLMPLLSIASSYAVIQLADKMKIRHAAVSANIWLPVVFAICLQPAIMSVLNARERLHDTRQLASDWARTYIPAGKTVLVEHFAFDLLREPWRFLFPLGKIGCVDVAALLDNKVQYKTIDDARGGLSNVDYGTMSIEKRDTCRADYAIISQYDRYRAERELYPEETNKYEELIAGGRIAATFKPVPHKTGGPVVRIISFEESRSEAKSPAVNLNASRPPRRPQSP